MAAQYTLGRLLMKAWRWIIMKSRSECLRLPPLVRALLLMPLRSLTRAFTHTHRHPHPYAHTTPTHPTPLAIAAMSLDLALSTAEEVGGAASMALLRRRSSFLGELIMAATQEALLGRDGGRVEAETRAAAEPMSCASP